MSEKELEKEAYLYAKNSKDVQYFECGFDIAFKSYLASAEPREKRIKELEKEIAELKKDKEDLIFIRNQKAKCMCEDKEQIEYAKVIIQDLLDNSDEYARQRAIDWLEETENV